MLIYNFQKEFLGIDESDLRKLGFANLSELRAEAADFADLFVKTPGFIHNFKHVHWIDFIECAESMDSANVIIHANNKNFKCTIDIQIAFLVDAPSQKAYLIHLNNLRELSKAESDQVANDVYERSAPQPASLETAQLQTQKSSHSFDNSSAESVCATQVSDDPYEKEETKEIIDTFDVSVEKTTQIEEKVEKTSKIPIELDVGQEDDFKLDIDMADTEELKAEVQPQEILVSSSSEADDGFDNDYVYDPNVASSELGLPLDLIEEFIGDFIAQAHDFKEQLYTSYEHGDLEKVKVLSHKLKGVAANLRIEDAFEVLATINTSQNYDEIKLNLDRFYRIIAKLSKDETQISEDKVNIESKTDVQQKEEETVKTDDDFAISFKDDDFEEEDNDIMDIPEIEDTEKLSEEDDFLLDTEEDLPLKAEQFLDTDEDIGIKPEKVEQTYDKVAVAGEIGIDEESFNELFADFLTESNLLIKDIDASIEDRNIELWRKNALKLKGMSDNMRVEDFKESLSVLVKTDDIEKAKEAIESIRISLEKISNL